MSTKELWNKAKPILTEEKVMFGLWMVVALASALTRITPAQHNNLLIFKGAFWHLWNQLPLYAEYPLEYNDLFHYGPFFSIIIAPFALVPDWLSIILWNVGLALLLYYAVRALRLTRYQHIFVLWFCAHELLTALFMQQFNVATVALILLSYAFTRDEKEVWATLMIAMGTFVKLYGIVGLAFFFFSKHKGKFILWGILWCIVLFVAPMLISSPSYTINQYSDWYLSLTDKNGGNGFALMQNISLLGLIRKGGYALLFGMDQLRLVLNGERVAKPCLWSCYSDLWIMIPCVLLFFASLCRKSQWGSEYYRLSILSSTLMLVCLLSTGTESSSYIIALIGVVLWFTASPQPRTVWDIALIIFAFLLTSMSPSDLFPAFLRNEWIKPFALKALPVALIWLQLSIELLTRNYTNPNIDN